MQKLKDTCNESINLGHIVTIILEKGVPMIQKLKSYYGKDIKINEAVLSEDYSWF